MNVVAIPRRTRAALVAENQRLKDALHGIKRTAELSAEIMRDPVRTGGWSGAERVAAAFDRIARAAGNS